MMAYNTARFDDPFDFGAAYNLTGCDDATACQSESTPVFRPAVPHPNRFHEGIPHTMDVFSLDEANPCGFLFRNRNIIPEQFAGGHLVAVADLPARPVMATRYFI